MGQLGNGSKRFLICVLSFVIIVYSAIGVRADTSTPVLEIGVGLSKPPYVIQSEGRGLEVDIVRRTFEIAGYEIKPIYLPLRRIVHDLQRRRLDGGMHLNAGLGLDIHFSDVVITYQNVVISRAEKNYKIGNIIDLAGLRIAAFQNARKVLGETYRNATELSKSYKEIPDQERQVRMLFADRTDVLVMDFRIFLHFKELLEKEFGGSHKFVLHQIFKPTTYRVGFVSKEVRDDFNKALKVLRESDEYQSIHDRYLDKSSLVEVTYAPVFNLQ